MNGHFNKRSRNQRRRQGVNPNRALDSNGPDVRIRGTAQQIYDKYLALARDATSSGDRVKAENYLQHAEHYFRVLRSMQGPQAQPFDQSGVDADMEGEQPSIGEPRDSREQRQPSPQFARADADGDAAGDEQPSNETTAGDGEDRASEGRSADARGPGGQDREGRRRRRRPRRPQEDSEGSDAGEETTPEPIGVN